MITLILIMVKSFLLYHRALLLFMILVLLRRFNFLDFNFVSFLIHPFLPFLQ